MKKLSYIILIIGAIVIIVMAVGIGLYYYNHHAIYSVMSYDNVSVSQEIQAYNNKFEFYSGRVTGSNASALMTRLISNYKNVEPEYRKEKLPNVYFEPADKLVEYDESKENTPEDYISGLKTIKHNMYDSFIYDVSFSYRETGYIDMITIVRIIDK